jgi:hypothetical protein
VSSAPFASLWPLLEQAPFAVAVRQSSWMFPTLESIHVLSVVLVVGTISIVDLRLLGLPTREKAVRRITQEVLPYTWGFFVLALVTGFLMFASSATTYAADLPFQLKMALMLLAGLNMAAFHLLPYRTVHLWDVLVHPPVGAKVMAAMSLGLWVGIVVFGRWIGFTTN